MQKQILRRANDMLMQEKINEGKIEKGNIASLLFEIYSTRQKFVYDLKERFKLYFGFLKCCLCSKIKTVVERKNKLFKKASERFDEDLDVIKVM